MGSKAFLFLGLFLAIFLMISSEVVARELAETSNSVNKVDVDGIGGDHYYGGYGKGGYGKGGYGKGGGYKHKPCHYRCKKYCCSYEEYVAMGKVTEAQPHN